MVKGSQDASLYHEYREGDIRVEHALPDGIYDVTLHFAEPDQIGGGERLFDTFMEDTLVIDDLDIMASRDGKVESALTVTIPDIEVSDGFLSVRFDASVRAPVLSAIAVRRPHTRDPMPGISAGRMNSTATRWTSTSGATTSGQRARSMTKTRRTRHDLATSAWKTGCW